MQEKLRLINFFEFQLDKEVSKPLGQMDSNAVDLYIKVLLDLQDKHIELSPEFIDEQVRKIFHPEESALPEAEKTTKKYFNKKKVWLVAACIAILVALFSIVSVANDWNVFDFLSEKFGSVHSTPIEEGVDFNGLTITNHGKTKNYSNVENALKSEKIDILYPEVLPNDISITNITISKGQNSEKIFFNFNDIELFLEISQNKTLTKTTKEDATAVQYINHFTCYIYEFPDINSYQINFEYNGDTYILNHSDKNLLIEIIENLKEIKNEN